MEFLTFFRIQWDRAVAIGAAALGALCILLGFIGVSNTAYVAGQLPYFISGGLFGIFLLGIAGVAWLTADLRDEWRELRALRTLVESDVRRSSASAAPAPTVERVAVASAPPRVARGPRKAVSTSSASTAAARRASAS